MGQDSYGLFVHGVGSQKEGYSSKAQKWLAAAREPADSYGQEVLWSQVLDGPERAMMREVGRRGSKNHPTQRLVVETLADALSFRNRLPSLLERFDLAYARLRAPDNKVNIYGHSLGVVLSLEWLKARPQVQVGKFISVGTNLQLFHLGREGDFVPPVQLASRPGVWVNYFSSSDMLGFPVGGWLPYVTDIEENVGGWFTKWNGLSHTAWWGDKSFWGRLGRSI